MVKSWGIILIVRYILHGQYGDFINILSFHQDVTAVSVHFDQVVRLYFQKEMIEFRQVHFAVVVQLIHKLIDQRSAAQHQTVFMLRNVGNEPIDHNLKRLLHKAGLNGVILKDENIEKVVDQVDSVFVDWQRNAN